MSPRPEQQLAEYHREVRHTQMILCSSRFNVKVRLSVESFVSFCFKLILTFLALLSWPMCSRKCGRKCSVTMRGSWSS